MNGSPFTAIGVDVGGTKIAAGIVTFPEGAVRSRRLLPTGVQRGAEAVLAEVEQLLTELAAEVGAAGQELHGIGLGVCEIVNRDGDLASSNCLDWMRANVPARLSSIAPTLLEADVRAAALAEALFGAGRDQRIFLYVSIGTGIACCLVIDGQPFLGARGATGTMASGPLPAFAETSAPTRMPSLEDVASGPALVARFNRLHGQAHSGQEVLAATTEDAGAANVVRSAAQALGGSIGWLVNVLDPELVILGGGLGLSDGFFRDHLVAAARRHIWWEGHRDVPIVSAQTGRDAGLIGAAAACWQRLGPAHLPRLP